MPQIHSLEKLKGSSLLLSLNKQKQPMWSLYTWLSVEQLGCPPVECVLEGHVEKEPCGAH